MTVGLASGSAGSLTGTLSMAATDGVAKFTDLVNTKSGPITLDATSGSLASGSTTSGTVAPATAYQLVVETQPSSTATAGVAFSTQPVIYVEDQFGNLETGDNSTVVTVSLGSGNGALLGTTSVTVRGGVAAFSNLGHNSAETISLNFSGGGLTSATSAAINVTPSPSSTPPTITGEKVVLTYLKHNKKGKPIGKPVVSIVFDYSIPMDPGTADDPANYQLDSVTTKKAKKVLHGVGILSATPNGSNTTVRLATSATQKTFAKGGQITVIYTPPNGISSAAGVPLAAGDSTFIISPKATSIAPS